MALCHGQVMKMPVIGAEIDITIKAGRDLVAKDGGTFSKGSSDPFVKIKGWNINKREWKIGKTKTVSKSLNPTFDETFKFHFNHMQTRGLVAQPKFTLIFSVFDDDKLSSDDPMGEVRVELSTEQASALHQVSYGARTVAHRAPPSPGRAGPKCGTGHEEAAADRSVPNYLYCR